ncbi:MAG: N-acetylmuramoyl-L-alanine amidase [Acidobacteriota bacterium]
MRTVALLVLVACGSHEATGHGSRAMGSPGSAASVAAGPKPDAGSPKLVIVDTPMAWSDERARLTLEYRRAHSDPDAKDLTITPRVIVLHYTAGGSAKATRRYFDHVRIEAARPELARAGAVNVSSHFLVDRDGTIYRLQPETRFARHCIGLNHIAIGIENVGDADKYPLTDAQVAADAALVRDLAARFPITHLLGHSEVMRFRDHPYYVERDRSYKNDKPDPGDAFMARVRAEVADLKLSGVDRR